MSKKNLEDLLAMERGLNKAVPAIGGHAPFEEDVWAQVKAAPDGVAAGYEMAEMEDRLSRRAREIAAKLGGEIATELVRLVPAKATHKAITWDAGTEILNLVQDNLSTILSGLRSLSLIGQPSDGVSWLPRAETWHEERTNWALEVRVLRQHITELEKITGAAKPFIALAEMGDERGAFSDTLDAARSSDDTVWCLTHFATRDELPTPAQWRALAAVNDHAPHCEKEAGVSGCTCGKEPGE